MSVTVTRIQFSLDRVTVYSTDGVLCILRGMLAQKFTETVMDIVVDAELAQRAIDERDLTRANGAKLSH